MDLLRLLAENLMKIFHRMPLPMRCPKKVLQIFFVSLYSAILDNTKPLQPHEQEKSVWLSVDEPVSEILAL